MKSFRTRDLGFMARVAAGSGLVVPVTSGLIRQWKADYFSLPNNTIVGGSGKEWVDSIAASNATTGDANVSTFLTAQFGALPGIGSPNFTISLPSLGDFTVMLVHKGVHSSDSQCLAATPTNFQMRLGRSGVDNLSFYPNGGTEIVSTTISPSTSPAARMVLWRRSGATVSFREAKTNYAAGSGTNSGVVNSFNRMGTSGVTGSWTTGPMAEVLIYNVQLNDTDCSSVYDLYLKPKWGLP